MWDVITKNSNGYEMASRIRNVLEDPIKGVLIVAKNQFTMQLVGGTIYDAAERTVAAPPDADSATLVVASGRMSLSEKVFGRAEDVQARLKDVVHQLVKRRFP
ncbi:MAG: hypothetical protein HQL18_05390, partial [Candidatus Omnitrophica bacterium]|nr:hypothetical protein [Candidatus Omnitrophota bacterium]